MSHDPEFDRPRSKGSSRRGSRLIEGALILAVGLVLVALLLPAAIRSAPEARRRVQCASNLRQVALALHNYQDKYGALPPSRTVDASGRPLHSWRTLILPFLNSDGLDRPIDLSRPWDDPANAGALGAMPAIFRCPSSLAPPNTTSYLAMVGPHACFELDRPRRLAEITNEHSRVLMLIEAGPDAAVPWMAPRDGDEALLDAPRSNHPGVRNAAMVDGRISFLRIKEPAGERREVTAISSGESQPGAAESSPSTPGQATPDPARPR